MWSNICLLQIVAELNREITVEQDLCISSCEPLTCSLITLLVGKIVAGLHSNWEGQIDQYSMK